MVITKVFNLIAELIIPIGIPTKEAKVEVETHLVTVKIKRSKCSLQLYKPFYASVSLIYFYLFLQLSNFFFHLYYSV